jgi:broad specificity phosphatase PhoE
MAIKHIYLVRHGETSGNHAWVHQSLDVSLDERGRHQAESAASVLAALPIDTLITSDAQRAQETAEIIARATHIAPRTLSLLRELRRAKSVDGTHILGFTSVVNSILLYIHSGNRAWHYGDGENLQELRDRAREALALLAREPGEHIVVVSHREFINSILFGVRHGFDSSMTRFAFTVELSMLHNGSITELTYDPFRACPWHVISSGCAHC